MLNGGSGWSRRGCAAGRAGALALWCALLAGRAARAQSESERARPPAYLEAGACSGADLAQVRRLLAVELQDLLLDSPAEHPEAVRVRVLCSEGYAEVFVDPPGGASLSQRVRLDAVPRAARARLLTLSAVELLFTEWIQRGTRPAATPAPSAERTTSGSAAPPGSVTPPGMTPLRAPPPRRLRAIPAPRFQLSLGGGLRAIGPQSQLLLGGGLRLDYGRPGEVGFQTDLLTEAGSSQGGTALQISLGLAVMLHARWLSLDLHIGVGLRGGASTLIPAPGAPEPAPPVVPWLGPMLLVGASVPLGRTFALSLRIEEGYSAPLGSTTPATSNLFGIWASAELSFGIRW